MTEEQWKVFCKFKKELKSKVEEWAESAPALSRLQREAALAAKTPLYPFETTVVYNRALDDLTPEDQIKLIVIGDNPGKDEQLAKNNRYLVGQAGKIAEGYFRRNPELGVDFRKNVIKFRAILPFCRRTWYTVPGKTESKITGGFLFYADKEHVSETDDLPGRRSADGCRNGVHGIG